MKRLLVVAASAAVLVGAGASGALAGEVKGPPTGGTPNTNTTAAPAHANSACAFSGLNDYIQGPKERQTQTPRDFKELFGPGLPGHGAPEIGFPLGCRGGSN